MPRLPKMPKGLMARIRKEERKLAGKSKVVARKKAIEAAKKKLEVLRNKNRK